MRYGAIYLGWSCCPDDRIVVRGWSAFVLVALNVATTRTATATAFRDARILRDATDKNGRCDSRKTRTSTGTGPSAMSRSISAETHQQFSVSVPRRYVRR